MIKYADVNLLIERPKLSGYMAESLPLSDTRIVGPRNGKFPLPNNFPSPPNKSVPWINYPAPPSIAINTLFWPTGASRNAIMYTLATEKMKTDIETAIAASSSTPLLQLGTSQKLRFSVPMHLLTPRPITSIGLGDSDSKAAWLLPLVDQRFWWQYENTGALSWDNSTTWATAFANISTALGVSFTQDTVDSDYLSPDWEEMTRQYDDIGTLLDAMCHSVGQRLIAVPDSTGTIEIVDFYDTGGTILGFPTLDKEWKIAAGGAMRHSANEHHVPAHVRVVNRKFANGVADSAGAVFSYAKTPATTVFDANDLESGSEHAIHSSAWANFTAGGGAPDNNTDLDALAAQIAADYYASLTVQYDYTFIGTVPWDLTPFDNFALWSPKDTRVQTMPPNVGLRRMWHQDATADGAGGTPTGSVSPARLSRGFRWHGYNSSDQTSVAAETTLVIDAEVAVVDNIFSLAANELTVNKTTIFDVTGKIHVTWTTPPGGAAHFENEAAELWMEKWNGSSWDKVRGTLAQAKLSFANITGGDVHADEATALFNIPVSVTSGDKFRLRVTALLHTTGGAAADYLSDGGGDHEGCQWAWHEA